MELIRFPHEIACPQRRTITTKEEYYKYINANLSSSNLFTTVYNYFEFEEKFNEFTGKYFKPNYDSAHIDRLWFDFDLDTIMPDKTVVHNDCYSMMKTLHLECLKHQYKHICRYTGSGFDVTIFTSDMYYARNKKDCIRNAVIDICEKLNIESDAKTLGDIARIHRITNTFNFKPKARRFCIPLTEEMINKGHEWIRETAHKQQFNNHTIGTRLMDISEYDYATTIDSSVMLEGNLEIKDTKMEGLSDSVPICIKHLLQKGTPSYTERLPIIIGLRELAFTENEAKQILYKYLDDRKFYHCVMEEQQLSYLYRSKHLIFPTQKEIMKMNACPHNQGEYCKNATRGCMNYRRL